MADQKGTESNTDVCYQTPSDQLALRSTRSESPEIPGDETQGLLKTEYFPQKRWSNQKVYTRATVVRIQPARHAPSWVGREYIVWISLFSLICCGFLLGLIAVISSWEAINKRKAGDYEKAKQYTILAIGLNIASIVAGIIAITVTVMAAVMIIQVN